MNPYNRMREAIQGVTSGEAASHISSQYYRIAPNFRGAKFSRIGIHKHFADQGFQLARPQAFRKAWGRRQIASKLATPLDWIVSTACTV